MKDENTIGQLVATLVADDNINCKIAKINRVEIPEEPAPNDFPTEALGPVLQSVVMKLKEVFQAPLAMCAQTVLAATNLATQGHCNVRVGSLRAPTNLFFITVALSGERKSALDSVALRPHTNIQRARLRTFAKEVTQYAVDKKKYDKANDDSLSRLTSGRVLPQPTEPISPITVHLDFTVEGLLKDLSRGFPAQGCFPPDGGVFTGGYSMNKTERIKSASILSLLWDSKDYQKSRGTSESFAVTGKRLCCHIMLQPEIARSFILDPVLNSQGIHGRFLLVYPESTIGSRSFCKTDIYSTREYLDYERVIDALYGKQFQFQPESNHQIDPRELTLASESERLWIEFYHEIEANLHESGPFNEIREFAAKAAEMALRIAGTLAIFDNQNCATIHPSIVQRSIDLLRFYLAEKIRFHKIEGVSGRFNKADALRAFIQQGNFEEVSSQYLMQFGPAWARRRDKLDDLMSILEEHGFVKPKTRSDRTKTVASWWVVSDED